MQEDLVQEEENYEKKPLFDENEPEVELTFQKEVNASEQIDLKNIIQLKEAFDAADEDKSGKLDMEEFINAFGSVLSKNMTSKKLEQLFMKIDANSDGGVEWDEFMNYILLENQTIAAMKEQDFNYVKSDMEDPPHGVGCCHEDMISKVMIIKPKGMIKSEGKFTISNKFVTSGKDGNIKFYNINGKFESNIEASVSYILSVAFLPECNTLVASTETKELLFFEVNPQIYQSSTPIGKYAPFPHTLIDIDGFYAKSQNKNFLIGGDDTGCLHFIEFGNDWHVCNDELSCHKSKHKEVYWNNMIRRRKEVIENVKKMNKEYEAEQKKRPQEEGKKEEDGNNKGKPEKKFKKMWQWKELVDKEKKNFFRVQNYHYMENITMCQLQLHTKTINKVQYISDLNTVVVCSSDCTISVLNFELLLKLKKEETQPVTLEKLIKLTNSELEMNIDKNKKMRIFSKHKKIVKTFLWSPKFRLMASGGDERHIILWDIFTCTTISYLYGHSSSIQDLTLNEERNHLISLGTDKMVIIWDLRSCSMLKVITDKIIYQPEDLLTCMVFDTNAERLVLTSRKMNYWPFRTRFEASGTSHDDEVTYCAYNPSFDYVISIDGCNNVASWDIKDGSLLFKFVPEGSARITAATLDEAGRRLIIGNAQGEVHIYNFNNGQLLQSVETERNVEITSLIHASQIDRSEMASIIATGWERKTYFWKENPDEVKLEKVIPKTSLFEYHKVDVVSMGFSEKYKTVITGDVEGILMVWDNKNCWLNKFTNFSSSAMSLNEVDKSIIKIIVIDDKDIFLPISSGQMIRVWSLFPQELLVEKAVFHYENELLTSAAVSQDGNYLVTTDSGGYFKIWDIKEINSVAPKRDNFKELVFIKGHKKEITCVDFIEHNEQLLIVTGSLDRNINLYTLEGALIGAFGTVTWSLTDQSFLKKLKPKYAPPETKKESPKKVSEVSLPKISEHDTKKQKNKSRISIDKELGTTLDKSDQRSSVRKNTGLLSTSRRSLSRTVGKGGFPSNTTIDEDSLEGDKLDRVNLSFNVNIVQLEPIKELSRVSQVSQTPFIGKGKPNWRERVEYSLMLANECLEKESWETSAYVENFLKKYGSATKPKTYFTKNAHGYGSSAARFLDSDKHIPLKASIKLEQITKYLVEEKNPSNKFNVELFHKGNLFLPQKAEKGPKNPAYVQEIISNEMAKKRSRSTNARVKLR